jgi:hypothetical protein
MSTGTTEAASGGHLSYVESVSVLSHLLLGANRMSITVVYAESLSNLFIHSAGTG